ncbi:hypothetical protein CPB84DRAFT_1784176 [Gymnopilus junonius]|uniref:Uncharacterized protein n=1 Tax=Gymnopilus junonius TaxID=109634 RepID=A0A9P5NH79_GYMJU|nr:hypothetical protein CPB84DRAFT_1784176 [Gymnopilus junonius]
MRKLSIPLASLGDAEYELYTASLKSLSHSHEEQHATANDDSDEYLDTLTFSMYEARRWFSGRFPHISSTITNEVLAMFSPQLDIGDTISASQFIAALRIVIHAERGKKVDRSLAYIAALPPASPYPVAPSQAENENMRFLVLHSEFWGNPLDQALTTLPSVMNTDDPRSEHEGDRNDDVLPGDPFLEVFQLVFWFELNIFAFLTVPCGFTMHMRCLGEKQPVIWYRSGEFHLFSNAGVQVIDPEYLRHPPFTCDSVPPEVAVQDNQVFPIYVTSPKEERWATLRQARTPELIVMNPWTRGELEKAAASIPPEHLRKFLSRFDNAGPSARFCLQYAPKTINQLYAHRNAVTFSKLDTPERFVAGFLDDKRRLRIGHLSEELCTVRRSDSTPLFIFWSWKEGDLVDVIMTFLLPALGVPHQHRFIREIEIVASPMCPSRTGDFDSSWQAIFGQLSKSPQSQEEALRKASRPYYFSFNLGPNVRTYDHSSGALSVEEDIYYCAIDSFIVHAGHLYMFRFASVSAALNSLSPLSAPENQHFVFVVPKSLAAFNCPFSDDAWVDDFIGR